jgi:hypothetical protein
VIAFVPTVTPPTAIWTGENIKNVPGLTIPNLQIRVDLRAFSANNASLSLGDMTKQLETVYPQNLIRIFAGGVWLSIIGVVGLMYGLIGGRHPVELGSSILLAVGTVAVALSLLRGQDIDEGQQRHS